MPLPSRFTSLYRLCLRATAASVRHHGGATRNMRALYRPAFEDAAKVVKELEHNLGPDEAKEKWWTEWEQRMYNTLSMLVLSANPLDSTIPSRVTRNLALVRFTHLSPRLSQTLQPSVRWNPQSPRMSIYKKELNESRRSGRFEVYTAVDRVLEDLFGAAEGSAGVVLGRIRPGVPGRRAKNNKKHGLSSRRRRRGAPEALAN